MTQLVTMAVVRVRRRFPASEFCVSVILVVGIVLLGFTGILELTWPQQLVLGLLTDPARNLDGPQLELVPCHPDADVCVGVLDLPLRVLENRDHGEVLSRSRLSMELAGWLLHVPASHR